MLIQEALGNTFYFFSNLTKKNIFIEILHAGSSFNSQTLQKTRGKRIDFEQKMRDRIIID
ncbi:MAG: hypothetical protein B6244_07660 [Candidatus Cloacimonetes bacterium 4572_55]|nr:MAG: hypothetical protein B6244_07660 [Candidatus Cloacimonetes bacterium 4572_55]